MKKYDGLFIIDPAKEKAIDEITANIEKGIAKNSGKVNKKEKWSKQRLAYPVNKNREGIYYKLNFSADPSKINALNAGYKLDPNILRVMITTR